MTDPIRTVHILFENHFGSNTREWPENAVELKNAITSHISDVCSSSRLRGKKEERERIILAITKFMEVM